MNRIMKKIIILLAVLSLAGCNMFSQTQVKYSITGSAGIVNITIENEDGGTSQFSDVLLPWEYAFESYGGFVYVSGQNLNSSGTVTASIYLDGKIYKTSTSSGAYSIATASGSF